MYKIKPIMEDALNFCRSNGIRVEKNSIFNQIYSFTTENISGYINSFKLCNKSLLTVGSSSDQAINAAMCGCFDITIYDVCPFTKYYFYLKAAAIETLSYEEFKGFFSYEHCVAKINPYTNKEYGEYFNHNVFNIESFNKLKNVLRIRDYESFLFWNQIFTDYKGKDIYFALFDHEGNRFEIHRLFSPYYKDERNYNYAKQIISHLKPNFIINNLNNFSDNRTYDNILLSNVSLYETTEDYKAIIDNISNYLNKDGKLQLAYLYEFDKKTIPQDNWKEIYNLKKMKKIYKEYNLRLESFPGRNNLIWGYKENHDSILIYKKK